MNTGCLEDNLFHETPRQLVVGRCVRAGLRCAVRPVCINLSPFAAKVRVRDGPAPKLSVFRFILVTRLRNKVHFQVACGTRVRHRAQTNGLSGGVPETPRQKSPHRMRLPTCGGHDLAHCDAFGPAQKRAHLGSLRSLPEGNPVLDRTHGTSAGVWTLCSMSGWIARQMRATGV
jgi:hypothetical protein